jgi:hypothetical protein
MRHKRLFIVLALTAHTTATGLPVFAQESTDYTTDIISVEDIYSGSTSGDYTPDIISVEDIYSSPTPNEVPTVEIPDGLAGIVFDVLGDKQEPGRARTINETQRKFLKAYEYGQKALKAYRLGKQVYEGVSRLFKNPKGVLGDSLTAILQDYNKIGNKNLPNADAGRDGSTSPIFPSPENPAQVYIQAKNDVARRMFLPSLMSQLVFSDEARTLREEQSKQLEESLTNTIEASQSLIQLSGSTSEAVAHNGDLAKAVVQEASKAQSLKSSQAVLKSLAAAGGHQAQQTATNGVILGNIQRSQVEQNRATTALVVSSTLAYQQRDIQNHLAASQNVFLEQIRADLGQQEDERQRADFAQINRQVNASSNVLIPGFSSTPPPPGQ